MTVSTMFQQNLFLSSFPIVKLKVYDHAIILERQSLVETKHIRGDRKEIKTLSKRSLSNLIFTVGNTSVKFKSMITLTYGQNYPVNGKKTKANLNRFLTQFKRMTGKFSYVWFLEFQKRSAPHLHILVSLDAPKSSGNELHQDLADLWSRIAEPYDVQYSDIRDYKQKTARLQVRRVHCHRDVWQSIKKPHGAARYVAKYASKPYQKEVPKNYRDVGRFWGCSRDVKRKIPQPTEIDVASEKEVRMYLAKKGRDDVADWEFLPKIVYT